MGSKIRFFRWEYLWVSLAVGIAAAPISAWGSGGAGKADLDGQLNELIRQYQRPQTIPFPESNSYTPERELLGRTLFFDPRLSGSGLMSCATCHNPALAWGDGLPRALGDGMKALDRRTPTILNLAWSELLFWDGRADSLEEQALKPVESEEEMNLPLSRMLEILRTLPGYVQLFQDAYPGEGINEETVAKAIAAYERTIVSGMAPFDRWVQGDDAAVSPAAKRGFYLFNTKAACASCHSGWRFTDDSFHDIGVADNDKGRGQHIPVELMQHAFKTPTLRNVDERYPYMHDGSEETLLDVIELYDRGGRIHRSSRSFQIRQLQLSESEKSDLLAFLATLTSKDKPVQLPALPR